MPIAASMVVRAIAELPRDREYSYINPQNHGRIRIVEVRPPNGPIYVKRYRPGSGETSEGAKIETISAPMIRRVANAMAEGMPLNVDRIVGASYNTRSVLEALLAHTPQFHICWPGRIEETASGTSVRRGHKHLMWLPGQPHRPGELHEITTDLVISELPSVSAVYEALVIPATTPGNTGLPEEVRRRHAQIQIALMVIAERLGMRPFVARNDQSIQYQGRALCERELVVTDLASVPLLSPFPDAVRAGSLIDCIWFRDGRHMPAVFEVEHTTGIASGLNRMLGFRQLAPGVASRFVIAAPDEDRERVLHHIAMPQFAPLNAAFMPYSAVEELFGLVSRRNLKGLVGDSFIDAFLEPSASLKG
jgi:type II restriction enzyme